MEHTPTPRSEEECLKLGVRVQTSVLRDCTLTHLMVLTICLVCEAWGRCLLWDYMSALELSVLDLGWLWENLDDDCSLTAVFGSKPPQSRLEVKPLPVCKPW